MATYLDRVSTICRIHLTYDKDGGLDVYLVQSGFLEQPQRKREQAQENPLPPYQDRLFRNDLEVQEDGRRTLRFTDVTETSGIRANGYGMGVATGDIKQPNQLFISRGQGRFEEVTESAGAAFQVSEVSRGAAFGDVDNDGDMDVLVSNNQGPARLLINQLYELDSSDPKGSTAASRPHWLGLRLLDAAGRNALAFPTLG